MLSKSLISFFIITNLDASLIITGVIDGDLNGGTPKAVILTATADITDLALYGIGSANNGGGSDGQEYTFASGTAMSGDMFLLAGNSDSASFFSSNFLNLSVLSTSSANINGDDAIELFESGSVIDTFGEIDIDGTGRDWEYTDGYAVRTGGAAGAFVLANYNIQEDGLVGFDEMATVSALASSFGLIAAPEPSTVFLTSLTLIGLLRRRRC